MDNNNPKPEIEKILRTCLENLRELAHTPSKSQSPYWKLCQPSEPLATAQMLFIVCRPKVSMGFLLGTPC